MRSRTAYYRIGWGLVLIMIDVRIQSFDLLPDIVGYVLVMIGLAGLREVDRRFAIGWWAAAAQLLLSLVSFALKPGLSSAEPGGLTIGQLAWSSVGIVAESIMIYGICAGLRAHAASLQRHDIEQAAHNRWLSYFVMSAAVLFMMPFGLNVQPGTYTPFMFLLWLIVFIAEAAIVLLARRAGRELDDHDSKAGGQ